MPAVKLRLKLLQVGVFQRRSCCDVQGSCLQGNELKLAFRAIQLPTRLKLSGMSRRNLCLLSLDGHPLAGGSTGLGSFGPSEQLLSTAMLGQQPVAPDAQTTYSRLAR